MSPAIKLRKGDKKKSEQKTKQGFFPWVHSVPYQWHLKWTLPLLIAKFFLISKNRTMPFVSKVFTIVPANWHLSSNYLQRAAQVQGQRIKVLLSSLKSQQETLSSFGRQMWISRNPQRISICFSPIWGGGGGSTGGNTQSESQVSPCAECQAANKVISK